jgi:hypothetical protein
MIQLIRGRAQQKASALDLMEQMKQCKSPLLIALNGICFEGDFTGSASESSEELSIKLDRMCIMIKGALKLYPE